MSVSDACTSAIGQEVRANLRGHCNPLPVLVGGLRLHDTSARNGAVRGRLLRLQMLPTGDSYFNY